MWDIVEGEEWVRKCLSSGRFSQCGAAQTSAVVVVVVVDLDLQKFVRGFREFL
jgi:hypothetical protein